MGKAARSRSHSFNSCVQTASPSVAAIDAARELMNLAIEVSGGEGTTFLHQMARCSSRHSAEFLDGLPLAHSFLRRAAQVDHAVASSQHHRQQQRCSVNKKQRSIVESLLCRQDDESGYNPLHAALYRRNLRMVLLLLRHAALADSPSDTDSDRHEVKTPHPMNLLSTLTAPSGTLRTAYNTYNSSHLLKNRVFIRMVTARDREGLTPLQLLCKALAAHLTKCRSSLRPNFTHTTFASFPVENDKALDPMGADAPSSAAIGGYRIRSGSLNYQDQRHPSISFHDLNYHSGIDGRYVFDHHDDDTDSQTSSRNEFTALQTSVNHWTRDDSSSFIDGSTRRSSGCYEYECEVMTFGPINHCALGVPHCASRRITGFIFGDNESVTVSGEDTTGVSACPRRVEAFALGDMGRDFFDKDCGSYKLENLERCTGGPAVAIAAAAHHTLVATRKGHLLAFGLGKGGRLGTGDEHHRPLPTRVLGPLLRRKVVSIAAALNHSLCVTSDGDVYAWGSNRFGQLGVSTCDNTYNSSRASGGKQVKAAQASNDQVNSVEQRCLPRRLDDLKHSFVTMVAAGDRHSVALTRCGEVFTWGDNRAGQLGMTIHGQSTADIGGNMSCSSSSLGISGGGGRECHRPSRVDILWRAQPRRVTFSIAAAEYSTLVLTRALGKTNTQSLNVVYGWGHGNYIPIKVNFPTSSGSSDDAFHRSDRKVQGHFYQVSKTVNPIGIASAKFHNVAMTDTGHVYTWGMHAEPLGTTKASLKGMANISDASGEGWEQSDKKPNVKSKSASTSSMVIASPQLVSSMLPENGGGVVVAVSASSNRTAVLTDDGHLYTWGAAYGNDVLGHEGVKWQPVPRRVPGVHRAVGLATAIEHTALLIGTTFPPLPKTGLDPSSVNTDVSVESHTEVLKIPLLQSIAARSVAAHVDSFNVMPILLTSERTNCLLLTKFCTEFVRTNLDAVLSLGKKEDLEAYLDEGMSDVADYRDNDDYKDDIFHPLLVALASCCGRAEEKQKSPLTEDGNWMESCIQLKHAVPQATWNTQLVKPSDVEGRHSVFLPQVKSATSRYENFGLSHRNDAYNINHLDKECCSGRCRLLVSDLDLTSLESMQAKSENLAKELRSARKKLSQVVDLEATMLDATKSNSSLLTEQVQKLARRPQLEADIALLEPLLARVETRICLMSVSEDSTEGAPCAQNKTTEPEYTVIEHDGKGCSSSKMKIETSNESKDCVPARLRCEECKIACPDDKSYELHMSGRRHRNKERQAQEEEERETAAAIMDMKKLQSMLVDTNDGGGKPQAQQGVSNLKKSCWTGSSNKGDSVQPKYILSPPTVYKSPTTIPNEVGDTKSSSSTVIWTNSEPKSRRDPCTPSNFASKLSFYQIMEEEERKARPLQYSSSKLSFSASPRKVSRSWSLAANQPSSASPPTNLRTWSLPAAKPSTSSPASPLIKTSAARQQEVKPQSSASLSLGASLQLEHKVSKAKEMTPKWPVGFSNVNESAPSFDEMTAASPNPKRSLYEIQQEEYEFKFKQDQSCSVEGKWYVQQRERAESLGEIQKREEEERSLQLLVKEQNEILEQIHRDRKLAMKKQTLEQKSHHRKHASMNNSRRRAKSKNMEDVDGKKNCSYVSKNKHASKKQS